jgi:hypothetical protein
MEGFKPDKPNTDVKRVKPGRKWPDWYPRISAFRNSNSGKAAWQLANTLIPYCFLWYLMVLQQHRLPPCPSSKPEDTQLLSERVLRRHSGAASQGAAYNSEEPVLYSTEFMGRRSAADGCLPLRCFVNNERQGLTANVAIDAG